jgi:hypothetical protein
VGAIIVTPGAAEDTTMRLTRRATRDHLTKSNDGRLRDRVGSTITGGPTEPTGLLEILEQGARGTSRSGAVSGAAQVVADDTSQLQRGIALSDGSRICFASIAEAGLFRDDDVAMARSVQLRFSRTPGTP